MSKSNPVYAFLSHNKYWIVLIVGILIVGVLDENSFYQRVKYDLQIEELKTKIAEYNAQYERDEAQLRELRRNPKAITKMVPVSMSSGSVIPPHGFSLWAPSCSLPCRYSRHTMATAS